MLHHLLHNRFTKSFKDWFICFSGKMGRFVSLDKFARNHPDRVEFVRRWEEQTIYTLPMLYGFETKNMTHGRKAAAFVVLMKDVACFAYSDLILLDDKVYYCEKKDDPIIGKTSDCADHFFALKIDEKYYFKVDIPRQTKSIESGIFLSGLFSWNYYHFTYEILPKLQWIDDIDISVPLLVDEKAVTIPSFMALLRICNKQKRPLIVMEERVRYNVDKLYYISKRTIIEPNHKNGTPYADVRLFYFPSTLLFLRNVVISKADDKKQYPQKVFIGRKYVTSGRRPFNEEECIACAQEYGFEVVYPEFLTLEQQVRLFNNAEMIIGGSGAAFTNLIYCKQGVKVLVFSKYRPKMPIWSTIVDFVGGDVFYLSETEKINTNSKKAHDSFNIDINKLKIALNAI